MHDTRGLGPGPNVLGDLCPVLAVDSESLKESLVFFVTPALGRRLALPTRFRISFPLD